MKGVMRGNAVDMAVAIKKILFHSCYAHRSATMVTT